MTNSLFFRNLPDFDSLDLEEEMEAIITSDDQVFKRLELLLDTFNWHEKMAIGQVAYSLIDTSHKQLAKVVPAHDEYDAPVKQAIEFVQLLSPEALAELASDILQVDFEIREVSDEN
jgi:hypothetical protein